MMNTEEKKKEIEKLVIARLEVIPADKKISIGSEGEFTKDELIQAVKSNSDLGKKIIEVQLEYLRLIKEGVLYDQNNVGH